MYFAFLENLARRETGRLPVATARDKPVRLIIYPVDVPHCKPFIDGDKSENEEFRFLEYGRRGEERGGDIAGIAGFAASLIRLLPICGQIDFFLFSDRGTRPFVYSAVILSRLLGVDVNLHDYRFRTGEPPELSRTLQSLCRRLDFGDISAVPDEYEGSRGISFRLEICNLEAYRGFVKPQAVPRVVVYGDFDDSRIVSLARRTHDMVKQKYPRTEFRLASLATGHDGGRWGNNGDRSIEMITPRSEDEIMRIFEASDTLLLLSKGGLNRYFMVRAGAAKYPIISNGIEYSPDFGRVITADRDSYSGLADGIIRLVDDEDYYRSFAASR